MKLNSLFLFFLITAFYFPFLPANEKIQSLHPAKSTNLTIRDNLSSPNATVINTEIPGLEVPHLKPGETVIKHRAYCLSYNEAFEQANWVAYELTKEETNPVVKRYNRFLIDPEVATGTADQKDYAKSGFDTGHLAPAGDMAWSQISMKECFFYSNMSPQYPSFNRGIWKQAEELVRTWAKEYSSIYIVTGPVLSPGLATIGKNKVAIPHYFYKVILDYHPPRMKGIGIIMENAASGEPLDSFAVTIDSVEKVTGIDFYPLLPDKFEEKLESSLDTDKWIW